MFFGAICLHIATECRLVGVPLADTLISGTRKGCPYGVLLIIMFIDKCIKDC